MAKWRQLPLPGEIVKKSNALLRCHWTAESVWEPRLVALLASKVHADDTDFQIYEIPVSEVMPERKTGGKDYKEIEDVVDRVMSRVLTIKDEVGRGWTKYNVFARCRYRPNDGILELGFHPDLRPHYLNLKKNFAKYNLIEFLSLPSIYSQRLFEILKSWSDKPDFIVNISDLHEMLNTPESARKNFAEFRRYILNKAHKDITKRTLLRYEWEPIKKGKRVVAIKFIFSQKRMLPVINQKIDEEKNKISEKNNKMFLTFAECVKKYGKTCEGGHQKKEICELCRTFNAR